MGAETAYFVEVEKAVEHPDGSATYTFDMSNKTRDMFVNDGIKLTLMCAAAGIGIEDAFDMLHDIARGKQDE